MLDIKVGQVALGSQAVGPSIPNHILELFGRYQFVESSDFLHNFLHSEIIGSVFPSKSLSSHVIYLSLIVDRAAVVFHHGTEVVNALVDRVIPNQIIVCND